MSAASHGAQRYPERKRTVVSYRESDNDLALDAMLAPMGEVDEECCNLELANNNNKSKKRKKKTDSNSKERNFPFLMLPGEIRNQIYKYVVTNPGNVVFIESQSLTSTRSRRFLTEGVDRRNWPVLHVRSKFRNLRLLRVCKTIYQETADFVYKQHFKLQRLVTLQTFLLLVRPATLARLRHVEIDIGDPEWHLLPMVSTQLIHLCNLTTLKITGLNYNTSHRDLDRYLQLTGRPISGWEATTDSLDRLNGIKLARDTYPCMFPLYKMVVRDNDIGRLVQVLEFSENLPGHWSNGFTWCSSWGWPAGLAALFGKVSTTKMTDERRLKTKKAMGEEIIRLVEEDSF